MPSRGHIASPRQRLSCAPRVEPPSSPRAGGRSSSTLEPDASYVAPRQARFHLISTGSGESASSAGGGPRCSPSTRTAARAASGTVTSTWPGCGRPGGRRPTRTPQAVIPHGMLVWMDDNLMFVRYADRRDRRVPEAERCSPADGRDGCRGCPPRPGVRHLARRYGRPGRPDQHDPARHDAPCRSERPWPPGRVGRSREDRGLGTGRARDDRYADLDDAVRRRRAREPRSSRRPTGSSPGHTATRACACTAPTAACASPRSPTRTSSPPYDDRSDQCRIGTAGRRRPLPLHRRQPTDQHRSRLGPGRRLGPARMRSSPPRATFRSLDF